MHVEGKVFHLCDRHGDLVQDEDDGVLRRSRKKVGMAMPKKINGCVVGFNDPRSDARCAYDGCGYPMSLVIYTPTFPEKSGGVPACNDHWRKIEESDVEWDGVWQRFLPLCKLDYAPLFEDDKKKRAQSISKETAPVKEEEPEGKTLEEVFEEEELDDDEQNLVDDLMKRLGSGELDIG